MTLPARLIAPRLAAQITGSHRQIEMLIDAPNASIHGLSNAVHGLAPAETFFNSCPDSLADGIADVGEHQAAYRFLGNDRVLYFDGITFG